MCTHTTHTMCVPDWLITWRGNERMRRSQDLIPRRHHSILLVHDLIQILIRIQDHLLLFEHHLDGRAASHVVCTCCLHGVYASASSLLLSYLVLCFWGYFAHSSSLALSGGVEAGGAVSGRLLLHRHGARKEER